VGKGNYRRVFHQPVKPKTSHGCLPKSRHSLQIGIKIFATIIPAGFGRSKAFKIWLGFKQTNDDFSTGMGGGFGLEYSPSLRL